MKDSKHKPIELNKKTLKSLKLKTRVRAGRPPRTGTATSCNGWCTNSSGYCCG